MVGKIGVVIMVKMKFYVGYYDGCITYKVRHFEELEEAQRVAYELEDLCRDLFNRRLICSYHFDFICR